MGGNRSVRTGLRPGRSISRWHLRDGEHLVFAGLARPHARKDSRTAGIHESRSRGRRSKIAVFVIPKHGGVRGESLKEQRYQATLFSVVAGVAILLAALGIYGLIAQSVAQRTREMGIRLALGATVKGVIRTAAAPGI